MAWPLIVNPYVEAPPAPPAPVDPAVPAVAAVMLVNTPVIELVAVAVKLGTLVKLGVAVVVGYVFENEFDVDE